MSESDHVAVYAAELAAFDGTDLEEIHEFSAIALLIHDVVNDSWWPRGPVVVRRARSDAGSSSARCVVGGPGAGGEGASTIRLAAGQMTVATAAHELAHCLAGTACRHDAVFRRAYLDVTLMITNTRSTDRRHEVHVEQLAHAFAAAGLPVGERRWPAPPEASGGAFAL